MFIHLHLLSTTVTHCISLVFILSATGTVLQHNHSARVTNDYYAVHIFSLFLRFAARNH